MDTKSGDPENIKPYWDFPKGGKKPNEDDISSIKRELFEELGTNKFEIKSKLPFKLVFEFPPETQLKINFDSQETTVFLVKFTGNKKELSIDGSEISEYGFFTFTEALKKLEKEESRQFFEKIQNYLT